MNRNVLGSILWILCFQYFVMQIIGGMTYSDHFSLAHNTISDLGNTVCGVYGTRYVCSPLHTFMNVSFVLLGITQLLGAVILYKSSKKQNSMLIGYGLMVLAGIGTIVVGLYPENTMGQIHAFGAALPFILGNVAMLFLANQSNFPGWLKLYSVASGFIGLMSLVLFITHNYLGLGQGGMERFVAYPQTIWMIMTGIFYLTTHRSTAPNIKGI